MTQYIDTLDALHALYGQPAEATQRKVTPALTECYRTYIERARFCILSTVGPEGTDGSPRGDIGPVVQLRDAQTLLLPDWQGNQRIDSLRNIVRDGRVSLIFLVAGSNTTLRVNGRARLTVDPQTLALFDREGAQPRSVIEISIIETYPQCARALMRSELWTSGDQSAGLPSMGDMLAEITSGAFDGAVYDQTWPERAKTTMW